MIKIFTFHLFTYPKPMKYVRMGTLSSALERKNSITKGLKAVKTPYAEPSDPTAGAYVDQIHMHTRQKYNAHLQDMYRSPGDADQKKPQHCP